MYRVTFVILLCLSSVAAAADEKIKALCRETGLAYAHYADTGAINRFPELFTSDAVYQTSSFRLEGDQIRQIGKGPARPSHTTMHVVTNHRIEISNKQITGTSYYQLFRAPEPGEPPHPIAGQPVYVGVYEDIYAIEDGQCRFKSRIAKRNFVQSLPE